MFSVDKFISDYVIMRSESMFLQDIEKNRTALASALAGRSILVIGGAGSIGSSFIKAVLPFAPGALVVVDTNENALAELTRDLRSGAVSSLPAEYLAYPMDYSTHVFRKMFCAGSGFDIVANFSAHKHVRSEKDIYSVEALLQNNLIHAEQLLKLLTEYPPEEYFCVSTDKAANPVNIMGASKRIMEDLIFAYSDAFPVKTSRFANVAFSNGSLLDGFLSRIRKLQPLSAPMDIRRYFVSPEEAGQICMLSCVLGNNREIFFPKLREDQMQSFDVIACNLLNELGYQSVVCHTPEEAVERAEQLKKGSREYPVYFSESDTSGEKKTEEFYIDSEETEWDRFDSLGVVVNKSKPDQFKVSDLVRKLDYAFETKKSKKDIVTLMQEYLPEFHHIETGRSLDYKM